MSGVGDLLAEFRKKRRLSQLDLGGMAEVSARHLGFIETNRSTPSREMLLRLADVMDLSLHEVNLLLSASGYALIYPRHDLSSPELAPAREALELILDNHNPYPALVMDGDWNMLLANAAQFRLAGFLADGRDSPIETNLLKLFFSPEGYRPFVDNWEEMASFLLRRLRKQVMVSGRDSLHQLFEDLLAMDPPQNWTQPPTEQVEAPLVCAHITLGDHQLRLFSSLTQFGSVLDIGLEELFIESYFPANAATRKFFTQTLAER